MINNCLFVYLIIVWLVGWLVVYLKIGLVVAMDDSRQEISKSLARTCLCDSNHVLKKILNFVSFYTAKRANFLLENTFLACFHLSSECKWPALWLNWGRRSVASLPEIWFKSKCIQLAWKWIRIKEERKNMSGNKLSAKTKLFQTKTAIFLKRMPFEDIKSALAHQQD